MIQRPPPWIHHAPPRLQEVPSSSLLGISPWPAEIASADGTTLLLVQHEMSAAGLSRLLGSDRSLGPKLLRGERRLTVGHIRTLAQHFNVEPGVLL